MITRSVIAAGLLALTAGCGNMSQGGDTRAAVTQGLRGLIPWGREDATAPAPTPAALRAQATAGSIFFEIPAFSIASAGIPATVNNTKVTWLAAPVSVTTQYGFLIATRGLPENVLAIEVHGFGDAMTNGGTYTRDMEWLSDRDSVKRSHFSCTITIRRDQSFDLDGQRIPATLYEDTCTGDGVQFTNHYWVDSARALRKTRQWVSKSVGYLQTYQL